MIDGFSSISDGIFEVKHEPCVIGKKLIELLLEQANTAVNKRARLLLHPNISDNIHEMVIALPIGSFDRPHINFKSSKSFLALKGSFAVVLFNDSGKLMQPEILSENWLIGNKLIRMNTPTWHTIVPLTDYCVFLETIAGPFEGNKFAPFSPLLSNVELFNKFKEKITNYVYEFANR